MIPIIDTHQHLWDLTQFRLPWQEVGSPLARNHVMADYLEAVHGLNVVKSVYMEVDVDPNQKQAEAGNVIVLCSRGDNPMVGAVIRGNPAESGFDAYIEQFKGNPCVKGFRQVLHGPQPTGYCLQQDFIRGARALGELGFSFDLCMRADELPHGAKLAQSCADTQFILDHCGNADVKSTDRSPWKRDMESIAKCENVVCKVSGIVASAPPNWTSDMLAPIINHTAEVFGPERIMFGSDWPVCTLRATYREWVEALNQVISSWPESDKQKLFHQNAAAFYRI